MARAANRVGIEALPLLCELDLRLFYFRKHGGINHVFLTIKLLERHSNLRGHGLHNAEKEARRFFNLKVVNGDVGREPIGFLESF